MQPKKKDMIWINSQLVRMRVDWGGQEMEVLHVS